MHESLNADLGQNGEYQAWKLNAETIKCRSRTNGEYQAWECAETQAPGGAPLFFLFSGPGSENYGGDDVYDDLESEITDSLSRLKMPFINSQPPTHA